MVSPSLEACTWMETGRKMWETGKKKAADLGFEQCVKTSSNTKIMHGIQQSAPQACFEILLGLATAYTPTLVKVLFWSVAKTFVLSLVRGAAAKVLEATKRYDVLNTYVRQNGKAPPLQIRCIRAEGWTLY